MFGCISGNHVHFLLVNLWIELLPQFYMARVKYEFSLICNLIMKYFDVNPPQTGKKGLAVRFLALTLAWRILILGLICGKRWWRWQDPRRVDNEKQRTKRTVHKPFYEIRHLKSHSSWEFLLISNFNRQNPISGIYLINQPRGSNHEALYGLRDSSA